MTEEEWEATAPGHAVGTFNRSILNLAVVTMANSTGGMLASAVTTAWLKSALPEDEAVLIDRKHQAALLKATTIIAAFSVFEAYVEDFVKGVMALNRSILDDDRILALKVPMRDFLAPEEQKLDIVYRAMKEAVGRTPGVLRYEDLLKLVGLSGRAPKLVKDEFYKAQMVRHVWAHNAGIADGDFVSRAAHLDFNTGELVDIDMRQSTDFIIATAAYGMIIGNRHRKQCGLSHLPLGLDKGKGKAGPVFEAFRGFYKSK